MKIENSSILNCFPFAPKYCQLKTLELSGEIRLYTGENEAKEPNVPLIKEPNVPLILGAGLEFLCSKVSISEPISKTQEVTPGREYAPSKSYNIEPKNPRFLAQANDLNGFWDDIGDWFDEPEVENANRDDAKDETDDTQPQACPFDPVDALAVYKPAHFATGDLYDYGIFFKKETFLNSVVPYINNLKLPGSSEEFNSKLLSLIYYHVFAHEVCHSWIEDIVSMVDFEMGMSSGQPNSYLSTHQKYGGFIAREEAVCETAAYGWVHDCLKKSLTKNPSNKAEIDSLKEEYKKWLNYSVSGLVGYSNYCKNVKEAPIRNQTFIKGLARLISTRYLNRSNTELCRKVIESYFGGKINRSNRTYISKVNAPLPGTPQFAELSTAPWMKLVPRGCE
jgi:hypothetical protein